MLKANEARELTKQAPTLLAMDFIDELEAMIKDEASEGYYYATKTAQGRMDLDVVKDHFELAGYKVEIVEPEPGVLCSYIDSKIVTVSWDEDE